MRISRKADHALRAILQLALHAPLGQAVRANEIANDTGIPPKFLTVILADLVKAGLVASKRGPDGGHMLARDAAQVTVNDVIGAVDVQVVVSASAHSGARTDFCLAEFWAEVDRAVHTVTERVTLGSLRRCVQEHSTPDFSI